MKFSEMFPSPWLKAEDIGDGTKLTINSVTKEVVGQDKELKNVVHWLEPSKPMILNRTNGTSIMEMYGDDSAEWIGKSIELYQTGIEVGGKAYQAVRVKQPQQELQF